MSSLALMFHYLDGIFAIRNSNFSVFNDGNTISANSTISVHELLLSNLSNKSKKNALVFNNEISLLRELGNISDNEIKVFLSTFTNWDLLVLSPYKGTDLVGVPNYSVVKKANNLVTFTDKYVYIASSQFMKKVKDNDIDNIQTYIYTNPFLEAIYSNSSNTDKYIVSQVTELNNATSTNVSYKWKGVSLL